MDLDALYDNNPHDGTATPFKSGTKRRGVKGTLLVHARMVDCAVFVMDNVW